MLYRIMGAVSVLALAVTAVAAQDVITERRELMKKSGAQARVATQMIRGDAPFDLAKAEAALAVFADKAARLPNLFPESSKTGDTRSLPAIWDKRPEFDAAVAKFAADVKAAQASVKDLDTFKAGMQKIGGDCSACHESFRRPG